MKIFNKQNRLGSSGFSHFEMVLIVIVVAIITAAGAYIFNFNKNKSKALQPVINKTDLLFSMPATKIGGVNTKVDYYGCVDNRASSSTKGTKVFYGLVTYPGVNVRPATPNVNFYANVYDDTPTDPTDALLASYDLSFNDKKNIFYVTNIYYWTGGNFGLRPPYSVFIKDTAGNIVYTGNVDLSKVTSSCPDWTQQSIDKLKDPKSTTKPPTTKKNPKKKPTTTSTTASTGGATPMQTPPTKVVKKYPRTYDNFTRVHHMYKVVKDKKGTDITRASNYDIFWKDSSKQILIVQYRVNVVPGSGLIPGLFYSNVYIDKPISGNAAHNKTIRVASFAISNPVGKTEYMSPLQNASSTTVMNNIKKPSAIPGRYWGEAHITRKQMKGKNILYFNVGYDSSRKLTEKAYVKSQAYDVNKAGWLNKVPGEKQPRIRK